MTAVLGAREDGYVPAIWRTGGSWPGQFQVTRSLNRSGPTALLIPAERTHRAGGAAAPGAETRLVGGCVRDCLLGTEAADIDLATTLLPEENDGGGLRGRGEGGADRDRARTITLVAAGEPVEVTTLREESRPMGAMPSSARPRLRPRCGAREFHHQRAHPRSRRAPPRHGRRDSGPGGGSGALHRRCAHPHPRGCPADPPLLPVPRPGSASAMPDPNALAACIAARDSLDGLSKERVRTEFLKLLMAERGVPVVSILAATDCSRASPAVSGNTGGAGASRQGRAARRVALAALAVHTPGRGPVARTAQRLSKAEAGELAAYAGALAALHDRAHLDVGEARALTADHGAHMVAATLAILRGEPRPALSAEARQENRPPSRRRARPVFPVNGADHCSGRHPPGPCHRAGPRGGTRGMAAPGMPRGCAQPPRCFLAIAQAAAQ